MEGFSGIYNPNLPFGILSGEFYHSVRRIVDVKNTNLHIKWDWLNVDNLRHREAEFARKLRLGAIRGAVGAVNGCLIWQKNPGVSVDILLRYYCARKWKLALLLIAICDTKRRFLWIDIGFTPTTHDSLAWTCSGSRHIECQEALHDSFSTCWLCVHL